MSEVKKENNQDYWVGRWQDGQTGWHKTDRNPFIEKYCDEFTGGKGEGKLFFPLCGKVIDMKWMADLGYTVVGVEAAEKGLREFFQENNLEYTEVGDVEGWGGKLFQSADGKIKLYCGNFFEFNSKVEGDFDAVYDRGSLVAILPEDRIRYGQLMAQKGLLKTNCRYFLETFEYDPSLYPGPPRHVPMSQVEGIFSENFDLELRETVDYSNEGPFGRIGIKCDLRFHVLTPKS